MSPSPRFSILIPTRNRPEFLRTTLQSCLSQSFSDFEIIVSDNSVSHPARELIEQFSDPRIRYFHQESELEMFGNWEFTYSQARGDFQILIGDDDAIVPNCLEVIQGIIAESGCDFVACDYARYVYPAGVSGRGLKGNSYWYPTRESTDVFALSKLEILATCFESSGLTKAASTKTKLIPHPLASFISKELLDVTRRHQGRIMAFPQGDAGILVAVGLAKNIRYVPRPLVILGMQPQAASNNMLAGKREAYRKYMNRMELTPLSGCTFANTVLETHLGIANVFRTNPETLGFPVELQASIVIRHFREILSDERWSARQLLELARDLVRVTFSNRISLSRKGEIISGFVRLLLRTLFDRVRGRKSSYAVDKIEYQDCPDNVTDILSFATELKRLQA